MTDFTTPEYGAMEDEQLAVLAKAGDATASDELYHRYKNIVRGKARPYFLVGADRDDLIQEGMIGLFKAIRDFFGREEQRLPPLRGDLHNAPDTDRHKAGHPQQAQAAEQLRFPL